MFFMNNIKWSPWLGIVKVINGGYLQIPNGVFKVLSKLGFTPKEMFVLFYYMSKIREDNFLVRSEPDAVKDYADCNNRCYYSALNKMVSWGLTKNGPCTYDMEPFLKQVKQFVDNTL